MLRIVLRTRPGVAPNSKAFVHDESQTCQLHAHRAIVRFVSDTAKSAKTKGFISPNETKHFVWLVISD
jgi:hypothetical protein